MYMSKSTRAPRGWGLTSIYNQKARGHLEGGVHRAVDAMDPSESDGGKEFVASRLQIPLETGSCKIAGDPVERQGLNEDVGPV